MHGSVWESLVFVLAFASRLRFGLVSCLRLGRVGRWVGAWLGWCFQKLGVVSSELLTPFFGVWSRTFFAWISISKKRLASVQGVLELLGTSPHILLSPLSSEASGQPLALHAGPRCSRTQGEVAVCSGTTGAVALGTVRTFSFAHPCRSFQLCTIPLFRTVPAQFDHLAAVLFCACA